MLFSMLVSLYTSRVVLNTLGVEDYGIYNVVGGFVAMFSLVSNALSSSVSRFLTFELGKGDLVKLKRIFSTSMWIHIALAFVIFLLMESIGLWFLNTKMTFPLDRLSAANYVFQASILSFLINLFIVPYNASIIAHEKMGVFAYIGILDVTLKLCIILFIAYSSAAFDNLIVYAILLMCSSLMMQVIYVLYCRRHFPECRIQMNFDKECWKDMSSFAGWNFIGCTAGLLKDQGINVLLNLFSGPVLNAARGISTTVNNTVVAFAGNFMVALNPQIIKSYANNEVPYAISLVERGSRFAFYILQFFAIPILLETEFVLTLWLKNYPEHTLFFVRFILIVSLVDIISNTLINLQIATGKIRDYQIAVGGMLMMNFPLSYICLNLGYPPESVYIVALFVAMACLFLRLYFLNKMVGLSILHFLKSVCLNILKVVGFSLPIPLLVSCYFDAGWIRFIVVLLLSSLCSIFTIMFVGCSFEERQFIIEKVNQIKTKVLHD